MCRTGLGESVQSRQIYNYVTTLCNKRLFKDMKCYLTYSQNTELILFPRELRGNSSVHKMLIFLLKSSDINLNEENCAFWTESCKLLTCSSREELPFHP